MSTIQEKGPASKVTTEVGLVGLGAMGRGVASNLLAKGHTVVGRDVSAEALTWLESQGGRAGRSAAEFGDCAVVVSFVVDDSQTEQVLFGPDGLASHMRRGSVFVACSTMPPRYVRELEGRLGALGVPLIDAPVTGGKVGAARGTLTIMGSGDKQAFERVRPVLEAFGKRVYHLGDRAGAGAQMKIINQLMCGVHIVAAAEALAMAKSCGLSLDQTLEILGSGAANSWMLGDRGPRMAREAYDDVTSAVDIFVKDMGLVIDAARQARFAAPLAHTAYLAFLEASAHGLGRLDDSAVMRNYTDGRNLE
jgi:3-hydroxyisobutyrate dehydrogenase